MERKLFFFDVDGTLIDDETKICPQSAVEAIHSLQAAGHLVFINSGRTLCFLEYEMENFGISCAACGCGTQIIVNGNTLMEKRISHRRGLEIRKLIQELKLDAVLEAQEAIYFSDRPFKNPEIMEGLLDYISCYAETEVNALEDHSYDFDKFCIQTSPLFPERELVQKLVTEVPDFDCIDRGRGFYEFVPLGCSKGSAINFVRKHYGVRPEDCYVFGDSANDLTMFTSEAGHRIAMAVHDTVLESYATMIAGKVLDDGIAQALHALNVL